MFLALGSLGKEHAGASLRAVRVGCPSISVASLDRSVDFYTTVLNFQVVSREDSSQAAKLAPGASPQVRCQNSQAFTRCGMPCDDPIQQPQGESFSCRFASQRLLVRTRSHRGFQYGSGVPASAGSAGSLRFQHSANPARVEQGGGRHFRFLFSRPGWPLPRTHPLS